MSETEFQPKSFFKKPENIVGMIPLIAIGIAGFWCWGVILPFILAAAEETLNLVVVCAALGAIAFMALDKSFRNNLFFMYRSVMRKFAGLVVDMDPIGILKTILEKAKAKKEELEKSIGDIKAQRIALARSLEANQKEYDKSMRALGTAKKQAASVDPDAQHQASRIITLESKQIDRLNTLLGMQHKHMERYDFVVQCLTRYGEVCDDTLIDAQRDIDFRKQEQAQSRSFSKGMNAVSSILRGSTEDLDMQDMANEALEREYTQRMGDIENILDLTKNTITKADFNDAAAMEHADELLNAWKNKDTGEQLGKGTKQNLISAAERGIPMTTRPQYSQIPAQQDGGDEYRNLLR